MKEWNIPPGAVLADKSQQVPNNSYDPPPAYYVDKEFICRDCGRHEIWTGEQQKWYYEVAKGSLYATAIRCRDCRQKYSELHNGRGDPTPIKHAGTLMKRIRGIIEPWLLQAGFVLEEKNNVSNSRSYWLEYTRPGLTFLCASLSGKAEVKAETMSDKAECRTIATLDLNYSDSAARLLIRIEEFTSSIREFIQSLPE